MNGGPEVPSLGDTFRTPASWTSEGQQGAGALQRAPQRGMQTEGPLPRKVLEEGGSEQLRKALEETMMEQVLEENRQLQEELQRLRREQRDTGGGHGRQEPMTREDRERTPPPRPPTWPPPSSPQSRRQKKVVYTPQGTEVPSPPRGGFPVEDGSLPFPMPWQGGGEYATEVRQLFPEPASGFTNGGEWERPERHEERVHRLEREVETLRELMHRDQKGPGGATASGDYWRMPVQRDERAAARGEIQRLRENVSEQKVRAEYCEERTEDSLRSFPITLPKLASPSEKNAALLAGDWLTQIKPLISDVSSKASVWWDLVLQQTMAKYSMWLEAGPLDKLRILPPSDEEIPGYGRLVQRVTTMLLAAVLEELRGELISTRQLTLQGILFRVLKAFQPGSLYERSQTLAALTGASQAGSPQEAVDALRLWRRQLLRAGELGASLPDPILMVNALDRIMMGLLQAQPQAAFRVSSYRMQHGIDIRPSKEAVQQFHELLQAEAEMMVGGVQQQDLTMVKAMGTTPSTPTREAPQGSGVCRWWGSEQGCRMGRNCRFQHPMLEDKANRCWTCSARGHRKAEFPHRSNGQQSPDATGGSDQPGPSGGARGDSEGKGQGKGKKGGKGKSFNKSSGKSEDQERKGTTPSTSATTENPKKDEEQNPVPTVKATMAQDPGTGELVSEVTSLLRSLRVGNGPQMRACYIKRIQDGKPGEVLLDGGATHCLRRAKDQREWDRARPIQVQLAEGSVCLRQDPDTGVLLTLSEAQTIIPMSKLIELSYVLRWDAGGCNLEHPKHGVVPLRMMQGCPTVDAEWGQRMMLEAENEGRRRAHVRSVVACGLLAESQYEKDLAELKSEFPLVPEYILEKIPGAERWSSENIPMNRRQRRKIQLAKRVIVHAFAGDDDGRWKRYETQETAVLCLDLKNGMNLHNPHVCGWIESLIDSGKVTMWLGGPPCRTVSVCRHRNDGGPGPLRTRETSQRFGVEGLADWQKEVTDGDTTLWLRNLRWMKRAMKRNPNVKILLEQPQDPDKWKARKPGEDPYPSFLAWPETKEMQSCLGLETTRLNQGGLGHPTEKPTTLIHNMEEISKLEGCRGKESTPWPQTPEERMKFSKKLARWAPGLIEAIAREIRKQEDNPRLQALSAKQKQELETYEKHCEANHLPYRRDCAVCVEGAGRDRCRRKVQHPEAFSWSIDLAGPFQQGLDPETKKPRYFMIHTITVPTKDGIPMAQGLEAMRSESGEQGRKGGTGGGGVRSSAG